MASSHRDPTVKTAPPGTALSVVLASIKQSLVYSLREHSNMLRSSESDKMVKRVTKTRRPISQSKSEAHYIKDNTPGALLYHTKYTVPKALHQDHQTAEAEPPIHTRLEIR